MPLRRNRRQYEQLTDFDRGRIIGLREAGWSNRAYRPPPRSERYGSCSVLATVDHRRHPVPSRETIRRRLTEVGLRSRRPLRRLPLTPHHRQCRLDFCRPRATWSVTDWRRVIFSDESRFSLSADDHRTRVWRRTGQRSDPAFIVERHTAISTRYVDDILTPIVLPMLSSRPGAIYQQDNARPHTARLSQQCLQGYDVLPWPRQVTRSFANRACLDALGRQLQPSRDTEN
ncbi:HTH_Tnp_Tc3_2 domain-containing protein [Trichonephila clavipes]|nr:HTH_Tnp_Tc3_2 domain-containing protein [Trichonephila clavipes]